MVTVRGGGFGLSWGLPLGTDLDVGVGLAEDGLLPWLGDAECGLRCSNDLSLGRPDGRLWRMWCGKKIGGCSPSEESPGPTPPKYITVSALCSDEEKSIDEPAELSPPDDLLRDPSELPPDDPDPLIP